MAPSLRFTAKFVYTTYPFKVRHNTSREKNSAVSGMSNVEKRMWREAG